MAQLNEWLSISKTSGTGNAEITLTASSYEELTQRTESLVVKGVNEEVYITVKQKAFTPTLSVQPTSLNFSYQGESKQITITSNVSWAIEVMGDWFTINRNNGERGTTTITITSGVNDTYLDRQGSITILYNGEEYAKVSLEQENKPLPSATLDSYEITAYREGTYTNGITSNVPWTAVVNGNWITIDKTQGESGYTPLSITVDASTETRSGSIIFNAEGVVLTLQIYQIYSLKESYFWIEFEDVGGTISDMDIRYADCEHSFDGIIWETTPNTLSMGNSTLVYFRANGDGNRDRTVPIKMNNVKAKIGGDISSILSKMGIWVCEIMFKDNINLTDASELILPWTTLANYCYSRMFENCTSLVNAPELPATTLASGCYSYMFSGCSSLTTAPELPATTLVLNCYNNMFLGCTSLVNAPALPATTLDGGCYEWMFDGCTSLVNAPELPATTLVGRCYVAMFKNCTSLVNAPVLPSTTLAEDCYNGMFENCTSLVNAPALPATTLAGWCYEGMFLRCTSLVNAPALPATVLVTSCYNSMFYGCVKLNYIKMLATDISANRCLDNWVVNVPSTGTFVKHPDADLPSGVSGIPSGWTVETATE